MLTGFKSFQVFYGCNWLQENMFYYRMTTSKIEHRDSTYFANLPSLNLLLPPKNIYKFFNGPCSMIGHPGVGCQKSFKACPNQRRRP